MILDLREVEKPTKYGAAENPHFFAALDFLKHHGDTQKDIERYVLQSRTKESNRILPFHKDKGQIFCRAKMEHQ